jgi:hypothetical protein
MEWRRRAKKDETTARDMKRESLDVIKRERMKCEQAKGNVVQFQGAGNSRVEAMKRIKVKWMECEQNKSFCLSGTKSL